MGCGEKRPKKELIRVVRTPEGAICMDDKGKLSGRGVYICPNPARKAKRFERSLETAIPDEVYEALAARLDEIAASGASAEVES